jgi:hypothetical protein
MKPNDIDVALRILRNAPPEKVMPLVKQWLAEEGYMVKKATMRTDGLCDDICEMFCVPCCHHISETASYRPDPTKCPAMLKAAKEGNEPR